MDLALPIMGGLGLFLYGMNMMGSGLEKAAGNKLKRMVEALTTNRFKGILVGTFVTMLIQSSSATTIMVVGFVNAGIMTLPQAIGVIMGANIGTTITAQLIAFNLIDYAPLAVAIGVAIWIAAKNKKAKTYSEVLLGFGILFIGMDMMGEGLKPLAEFPAFITIITGLKNPIMGMLVGFALTTIVQSSSASIGLLQALAGQNLVNMNMAFPILFGENIGTTTTALLSSIGTSKTAKRAAVIHLLMKIVGTIIFMTLLRYPIEALVIRLTPGDAVRQIANAHTTFNILNTIILYPFSTWIVKAAEFLVAGDDSKDMLESKYLDKRIIETPSIAFGQAGRETIRMGKMVLENLEACKTVLLEDKIKGIDEIYVKEKSINKIHREITDYLVLLSNAPMTEELHGDVNAMLYVIGDIERIGDHVENITELAQFKYDNNYSFSSQAAAELTEMFDKCNEVFKTSLEAYRFTDEKKARHVLALEDEVDRLEEQNRANHIYRLNKMLCSTGSGIVFLDVISNLERVSDHASNISMYVLDKFKNN